MGGLGQGVSNAGLITRCYFPPCHHDFSEFRAVRRCPRILRCPRVCKPGLSPDFSTRVREDDSQPVCRLLLLFRPWPPSAVVAHEISWRKVKETPAPPCVAFSPSCWSRARASRALSSVSIPRTTQPSLLWVPLVTNSHRSDEAQSRRRAQASAAPPREDKVPHQAVARD